MGDPCCNSTPRIYRAHRQPKRLKYQYVNGQGSTIEEAAV